MCACKYGMDPLQIENLGPVNSVDPPHCSDVESEWEIVLSTLHGMFGELDVKPPVEAHQLKSSDDLASEDLVHPQQPRVPDPPAPVTVKNQSQGLDPGVGIKQEHGFSPSVEPLQGCYQNYTPYCVRYGPQHPGATAMQPNYRWQHQLQHQTTNFWPMTVNNTQHYLGAMNGHGVSDGVTLPPCPVPSLPTTIFKPSRPVIQKPYIRRPPNAFMIFMRENRAQVNATSKPKHSVEANSMMGQMWQSMTAVEQEKYYLIAGEERRKHEVMHPDWSSKDNYGRKVKRRRIKLPKHEFP